MIRIFFQKLTKQISEQIFHQNQGFVGCTDFFLSLVHWSLANTDIYRISLITKQVYTLTVAEYSIFPFDL